MSMETATGIDSRSLPIVARSTMTARIGKRFWRIIVIALILALPIYYYTRGGTDAAKFVTVPVTRGPIVRSVTATGTVNPVTTVQVGTYVSGPIYCDQRRFQLAGQSRPVDGENRPAALSGASRSGAGGAGQRPSAVAKGSGQPGLPEAYLASRLATAEGNVVSQDTVDSQFNTYNQAVAQVGLDEAQYPAADGQSRSGRAQSALYQYRFAGGWHGGLAQRRCGPDRRGELSDADPVPGRAKT